MKIKLTRTVTEEVELNIEFPFFRKSSNTYYGIYSLNKGVRILYYSFYNTYQVSNMGVAEIESMILFDESNLEFIHVEITEEEFNKTKQDFLNRL